jgi:hypothetical protein
MPATTEARTEAAAIAVIYLDKGYDVRRKVLHSIDTGLADTIEVWDIYDGTSEEDILKGRITYHREDRGPQVTWHDEMR